MSSVSPQKGTGFFQDIRKAVLNRLSGRKGITKRLFKPRKLTEAEERRKETLEQKKKLTKKQKRELNILGATIAPREQEYQRYKALALRDRPAKQKAFNIFYEEEMPLSGQTEGLITVDRNYRKPLRNENLQVSNDEIPDPTDIREVIRRTVNGREMNLHRETQRMGLERMLSWFYEKAFGRPTETPHRATESEIKELQQHVQTILGTTQMPSDTEGVGDAIERIATEVFGAADVASLNTQIEREETGGEAVKKVVEVDGQYYISESYGAGLGRYLKWFFTDYNRFLMVAEYDEYQCWPDPTVPLEFTNDDHPQRQPLTTLKSNGCISLFNDPDAIYELNHTDGLQSNWIVMEPLYFPEISVKKSTGKKDFTAKYFQQASFIQDALDNWGITAMDPLLWKLFETKYPEIAIKLSTFLFTNFRDKIPLYFQKLKTKENFLIVDTSIEFEKNTKDFMALVHRNPFKEGSKYYPKLKQAIESKKLLGVSPYMAYFMKKTVPQFWTKAFGNTNMTTYNLLNAHEKIAIDYLQTLRYMETLMDSEYNFQRAKETYEDPLGDGSVREGIIKEIVDLYKENIRRHTLEIQFFQSLVTRQLKPDENPALLQTPEDITALLLKFTGPAIDYSARRGRSSALASAVLEANIVPRPVLSLRAPVVAATVPRGQIEQLRSRLNILRGERNSLEGNTSVYNSTRRKRRTPNEVNKRYKNLEKVLRTRANKLAVQVKRNATKAKLNRLGVLNRNIRSLEQQLTRLVPLPASPVNTGAGVGLSPRTTNSNSPNFPLAASVLGSP
jgi:hypothetical protein